MLDIIPIQDLKIREQEIFLLDSCDKLSAAEEQVLTGKTLNAEDGLASIREKYNV